MSYASATATAPARPKEAFYIPSLDGIRAAAVLLVFVAHAGLNVPIPGNFGVTVFFFLSGYLITTLARMECEQTGGMRLGHFYFRRVLRILPPFYVVLIGASLLCASGLIEGALEPGAVLAQVAHLSNYYIISDGWWDGRAPGTWVFWSLAVEEHFYLVFPVVYLFVRRRLPEARRQAIVFGALCLAVLAWRCLLVFALDAPRDRTYVATDTRMDSILFGCLLAVYGNPMLDASRVSRRWWQALWLPLGAAGLVVSFLVRDQRFQETFRYSLQGIALVPFFVVAVRYPDWGPVRLLNVRWIRFVGLLSYSLYLVHPTVLFAVHQWTVWPKLVQGAVALGLSLGLAVAIYYLIEQPAARLRRRLSRTGARTETASDRRATTSPPAPRPAGPRPASAALPPPASAVTS